MFFKTLFFTNKVQRLNPTHKSRSCRFWVGHYFPQGNIKYSKGNFAVEENRNGENKETKTLSFAIRQPSFSCMKLSCLTFLLLIWKTHVIKYGLPIKHRIFMKIDYTIPGNAYCSISSGFRLNVETQLVFSGVGISLYLFTFLFCDSGLHL